MTLLNTIYNNKSITINYKFIYGNETHLHYGTSSEKLILNYVITLFSAS